MRLFTLALGAILAVAPLSAGKLSGRRAPSFALPDSKGKFIDILDYRGKPLLIDVMQTGCPHCQTLAKTLERIKAKYGARINILAIVNPPDTPQTVAQYIARYRVAYPILFDFGTTSANYMQATPQNSTIDLPHLFVVDRNGMIVEDYGWSEETKPYLEGDALFGVIDKLLAGNASATKK